jgi:hypothetical protein
VRRGGRGRDVDEVDHQLPAQAPVWVSVCGDHLLVDAPGREDLDVRITREQGCQPAGLAVGEQLDAGVEGPPGPVERVARQAAVAVEVKLDPPPAAVERVAGQPHHVKRVHDRGRVRDLL